MGSIAVGPKSYQLWYVMEKLFAWEQRCLPPNVETQLGEKKEGEGASVC